MKLDLVTKDIEDKFTRENFFRLKRELEAQQILDGFWQFFEITFTEGGTLVPIKHGMSFVPKDIIMLSIEGDYNFYFNHAEFDKENLYATLAGPCRVRFLAGSYKNKAYGGASTEIPFIPPTVGSSTGTPWHTGTGAPSSGLGVPGDFYLDTTSKNIYLKTGPATWTLEGKLFDGSSVIASEKLVKTFTAGETISALKLVYLSASNTIKTALPSSTYGEATAIGVAINGASTGGSVDVQLFGVMNDPSFGFAANALLFLSTSGSIVSTAPSSTFLTRVGYGLGSGAIFLNLEKPIVL